MTITREHLEKAAEQAGIDVEWGLYERGYWLRHKSEGFYRDARGIRHDWNPLTDRGQLHDLAMACKINIEPMTNEIAYSSGKVGVTSVAVNCQYFPALAEAVILACCEQFDAKE